MFKIVILICAKSLSPDACTEDTALDVSRAMRVPTAEQCGFFGQALLAPSAIVPDPQRQYAKIVCRRTTEELALQRRAPDEASRR